MKQNRNLPPILATFILLLGASVAMEILFSRYMYLPVFLFAQLLLLLGLSAALLALFGLIPPPKEAEPADAAADAPDGGVSDAGEPEAKPHGFFAGVRRVFGAIGRFFVGLWQAVSGFVRRRSVVIVLVLLAVLFVVEQIRFIPALRRFTDAAQVGYGTALALLLGSFVCIIFDKWCQWVYLAIPADAQGKDRLARATLHNLRLIVKIGRVCALAIAAVAVLKLTGIWDGQRWLCYGLIVVWAYCSIFLVVSLISRTIRRELHDSPRISIPLPFVGRGEDDDMQILSHLEANTGITFRSLWSLKYIKKILPYAVVLTAFFFWLATGLVQINPYEEGARYRLGKLDSNDILEPGLHLTLPWPFDKTVVYDTGHIRELTIGYSSDRQSDNLWTEEHGSNEYRLLLGEGNELVSINMRLEYEIDDLLEYVTAAADPASLLSAEAYELITDRTISADLDTLLSVDRTEFAHEFRDDLNAKLEEKPIGLSVVRVVVESIHPPVEVASIYQGVVSAELKAEAMIWEAEAKAAVTVAKAEAAYDTAVQTAQADYHTRVAAAEAGVTEFMAAVAADTEYRDAYRYYKYLDALQKALKGSRLYILGDDIDVGSLYLGGSYVVVGGQSASGAKS